MTVKQYLSQIRELDLRISRKQEEIDILNNELTRLSPYLQVDKVQSTPSNDRMAEQIAKKIEKEREINTLIDSYFDTKETIVRQIETMNNINYYNILHMKFIQNKSFDEIAEALGFSRRHIFNLYGLALIEFEQQYGKFYRNL